MLELINTNTNIGIDIVDICDCVCELFSQLQVLNMLSPPSRSQRLSHDVYAGDRVIIF